MNFSQFEHFFNEMGTYNSNGYQLVLLQLYLISTVIPEALNLNNLKIIEKYKYVIFRK